MKIQQRILCGTAVMAAIGMAGQGLAADGDFDPSWGGTGRVLLNPAPGNGNPDAMIVQDDGKVVTAGSCAGFTRTCVTRHLRNGTLDPTFGAPSSPGIFVSAAGTSTYYFGMAVGADGRILMVGNTSQQGVVMFSLDAMGTALSTFDIATPGDREYYLYGIKIQTDGKILLSGYDYDGFTGHFAACRLAASADVLDTAFGIDGCTTIEFSGTFSSADAPIALQPDGKIVLAGITGELDASGAPLAPYDFAIARLTPEGDLDDDAVSGFGVGGRVSFSWDIDAARDLKVDVDGSLVVAGTIRDYASPEEPSDFFVNRLTSRGFQDPGFGLPCAPTPCTAGPVFIDALNANLDDYLSAGIALQGDRRILLGGFSFQGDESYFNVTRVDRDGRLDASFGTAGTLLGYLGAAPVGDFPSSIALANGGLMMSAQSTSGNGAKQWAIAKLTIDAIFGSGFE